MGLWQHNDCGTIYSAKTPPFDCNICLGTGGWLHRGPAPNRTERRNRRFKGHRRKVMLKLVARDGGYCQWCFAVTNLTIDHIRPLSKGGTNDLDNLQILCASCNERKGDDWPTEPFSIPPEEAQENEGTLFSTFDIDCPVKPPSPYDAEAE